jgi:YHS domain-containing protein
LDLQSRDDELAGFGWRRASVWEKSVMSTRRTVLKLFAATAVVSGVASFEVLAQIRATAQTAAVPAADRIGLKGYDPVAYFTLSTPTPGLAAYEVAYDGVRYHFANARHRDMFKANPDRYAPQFGGACANNLANGVRRESDPTIWVIINDKLYVFAGAPGADRFRREGETAALKAEANWKTLRDAPSQ